MDTHLLEMRHTKKEEYNMDKKIVLNRIEKIVKRIRDEKGHTNGLYVASEILREINKLK